MSTRSLIARQTGNGFEAVYCHHDGYPEHHAPILTGHYAMDADVAALIDLGDLSSLGPELGRKHDFASHRDVHGAQGWCLAYGRDLNETGTEKRVYASEAELLKDARNRWADYVYMFRDGRWLVRRPAENAGDWRELNA